ncbi:hypothetical protein ABI_17480 [Asticcacaulis biprosthecium C19]|uniref:Uncharacterized protein n=1 Tax=Asticcacaulis biprosthecium C19 TaxID=715226 RepID=F4QKD0_9CAUL|nr:hypothetical protein ABI_17480 [Asticcacaulis biprosthecium C19]
MGPCPGTGRANGRTHRDMNPSGQCFIWASSGDFAKWPVS